MTDVYEHNVGDHEDPVPGATWLIGFIGVVLLVVVVLGVTSLYFGAEQEGEVTAVLDATSLDLEQLDAEQLARLVGPPRWIVTRIDQQEVDRQLVIPIDDAMRKVVEELGGSVPAE